MQIPSVAENPLATRLIEIMDVDQGGSIDFNEFVAGMSIFSSKTSRLKKLRCKQKLKLLAVSFCT